MQCSADVLRPWNTLMIDPLPQCSPTRRFAPNKSDRATARCNLQGTRDLGEQVTLHSRALLLCVLLPRLGLLCAIRSLAVKPGLHPLHLDLSWRGSLGLSRSTDF